MSKSRNVLAHGAIAGVLAATALALFFFVVDAIHAEPLRTPTFLADALLDGDPEVGLGAGGIVLYTFVHYAVFAAIGALVALLMSKLTAIPGFLLGIVLGVLLFDLMFYAGVVITGVDIVDALGWPEVLFGNVLAGITLMGYLHVTRTAPSMSWWEILGKHRIVKEGLFAGVISASAVAVWFLIFDVLSGRAFFTPAALGSALFGNAASPEDVAVSFGVVLSYTVVHFAAFIGVGLVGAALAVEAEEVSPPLVLVFIEAFIVLEALFIGLIAIFATWILDTLGWWNVLIGNVLAAIIVVGYLWRAHPVIAQRLQDGQSIERPA